MWVLPKNYQLSSHFAQDMVESKEDLTLPDLNIESSLMWRSKPSPLRTWCLRWKPDSYLPHLFTRILKPSQHTCFEEKLALSLAVIHANPLAEQVIDSEKMTQDTFGHLFGDTLQQLDLLGASLKTSKDTYRLDSPQLLATWKKMVISQRGEYSQRVKLAQATRESESISWATPNTMDHLPQRSEAATLKMAQGQRKGRSKPSNLREQVNPIAVAIYETANWPTPSARDYKGSNGFEATIAKLKAGQRAQMGQLPNAVMIANNGPGHLNPEWVEWLMGVPTGWTELDF